MPSTVSDSTTNPSSNSKMAENKNSVKVLDELMAKLNISKAQEDINAATYNLAVFINGPIEEHDAPTKYVFFLQYMEVDGHDWSCTVLRMLDFELF
jgi:elongation factor 3